MLVAQRVNDHVTAQRPHALCDQCIVQALGLTHQAHATQIIAHWNELGQRLAGLRGRGFLIAEINGALVAQQAFATFKANDLRCASRHGLMVPLGTRSGAGFPYWVAFLEEWEAAGRSFRFRSANLTFFQEIPGKRVVQLFRAEWPGVRDWGGGQIGFQSPGAAHPHWQFDALSEFVSDEVRRAEAARLASLFVSEPVIEEFGAADVEAMAELTFEEEVDVSWTRMHFANQARWSDTPWSGPGSGTACHTLAPAGLPNVRNWLVSALAYSLNELS